MRIVLELVYHGANYHGWQVQPGAITVQDIIQQKLKVLTRQDILLVGCGRTDAGVHAKQFFAHFDLTDDGINGFSKKSLNAILPNDLYIKNIFRADPEFHARFDAISRKYIYKIHFERDPFIAGDSYLLRESGCLSLSKLNECGRIVGELKEFDSFVKTGSDLTHYSCEIFESIWLELPNGQLEYHIKANRFVRGMVRLIVGMCINYALDKISLQQIKEDVSKRRQINKSWSVAAEGLSLVEILYPQDKINLWQRLDFRV